MVLSWCGTLDPGIGSCVHNGLFQSNEEEAGIRGELGLQGRTERAMNSVPQPVHSSFDELISMLRSEGHDQVAERLLVSCCKYQTK